MKTEGNISSSARNFAFHRVNRFLASLVLFVILVEQDSHAQLSITAPVGNGALPPTISSVPYTPSASAANETISLEKGSTATQEDTDEGERFDVYLSSPGVPKFEVDGYLYNISMIVSLLDNNNSSGARNMLPLLEKKPELDAGLSSELAAKIDTVWDVERLSSKIQKTDSDLANSIDKPDRSQDEIADAIRKQSEEQNKPEGNDSTIPPADPPATDGTVIPPPPGVPSTPTLTQEYIHNLQTKAQIDSNEQNKEELLRQAESEFCLYVSRLSAAHHYHHVIMAAGFYRRLFHTDTYPPDMQTEVKEAQDTSQRIIDSVKASQTDLEKGHIAHATEELETAFRLGSLTAEVLEIPQIQKSSIEGFRHQFNRLEILFQSKDFNGAESALLALAKVAPDFDASSFRNSIESTKAKSETLVNNGKLLIQKGNVDGAIQLFQEAENVWPTNPDLLGGALPLLQSEQAKDKSLADFDQLMAQKDYSAISERAKEFSQAVVSDSQRRHQLLSALAIAANTKAAITHSSLLQSNGDFAGAWETIQQALVEWPESVELNKIRGDLADKAGTFALAVGKAKEAESRQELGLSLSWYAVAQHLYPGSILAKEGVLRVSRAILNKT